MSQDVNTLVLEVSRQDNHLTLSIFELKELASTLKTYSQQDIDLAQINRACQEVTVILNKSNRGNYCDPQLLIQLEKTGQFLWDHLLTKQVKRKLNGLLSKELVLSLDESLIDIPWELLHDGQDFLCLQFNLGRVVRTKEQFPLNKYRSGSSIAKMLVLANPTGDLESAYSEGAFIKNQLDRRRNQIRVDFKSTNIDTLYIKKNLRDYDIVHFAGHCEYDNLDSQASGWLLSDGRFSTQDILKLGEGLALPNLIFSNACYSAKSSLDLTQDGYQEKTYSLAAAFLFSGVRHYIGTIWQLEDRASLLFAKEFYHQLIRGKGIGECIRLGRLKLKDDFGLKNFSWANYILYGDPNFILFSVAKPVLPILKLKQRVKRIIFFKKFLAKFIIFLSAVVIVSVVHIFLPAKSPATYFLFSQSNRLLQKGKNLEAIPIFQEIVKRQPSYLAVYPLLAKAYERSGQHEAALKYYFEYCLESQKKNDLKNLACAYIGIGWLNQLYGDYPKAFDFYDKAINLTRKNKDKLNEAQALRKLAVWYIDKENYDKALELLMKSSEINLENKYNNKHRYNLACDYFDIGLVFANKDDLEAARKFYDKSMNLFKKMQLKDELSDYYFNLGELYLFDKDYNQTRECYLQGLSIDEQKNDLPAIASDYNMIGELELEMGNLGEAESYFRKGEKISQEIKALPELAVSYYDLGSLNKKRGFKSKAREFFRDAQEIYRKIDTPVYQRIRQEFAELDSA